MGTILREEGISPVGIYRMDIKSKSGKKLILAITKLVKLTKVKKSKTAHKNLLKLGKQISESKDWRIKGKEVETFLKDRSSVM